MKKIEFDMNKIKEFVHDNSNYINYMYIYNILINEEKLSKEILKDDDKLTYLILLIENTYLKSMPKYDLAFICGVVADYSDEILSNNLETDLENLCSEAFIEYCRDIKWE